mgnify:CR=1 FL=1
MSRVRLLPLHRQDTAPQGGKGSTSLRTRTIRHIIVGFVETIGIFKDILDELVTRRRGGKRVGLNLGLVERNILSWHEKRLRQTRVAVGQFVVERDGVVSCLVSIRFARQKQVLVEQMFGSTALPLRLTTQVGSGVMGK